MNTHFTKYVTIPVGYEHGKQIQHKEFLAGEILPEELIERDHSSFYLIVPIFYGNLCFGYGVVGDSKIALHQEIFYSWTTSIGNGMENLRKWQLMNGMMERLNQVWLYDNLTQIYNRSGFFNQAEALLAKIQRKNSGICLIFIDMDGLKKVNDTYGHEEGDNYICAMAKILKHIQKEEDLIMRYGGDEFVYMGESLSEKEAENRKKEVRNYIHTYNEKKAQETPLRASIGIIFQKAEEVQDLKALIHQADQKMYIEKKKKNDLTSGLIRL